MSGGQLGQYMVDLKVLHERLHSWVTHDDPAEGYGHTQSAKLLLWGGRSTMNTGLDRRGDIVLGTYGVVRTELIRFRMIGNDVLFRL